MIAEAQRRRAFWQILLFSAGLVVLTVISAGSVYLVNKARDDSKWVVHTIEAEKPDQHAPAGNPACRERSPRLPSDASGGFPGRP
ncbi:hypothetical protein ACVWWP_005157 [Bradyrhizobium sp. LM3.6]